MNKYFLIYTKFAVGGKGSKTHIFILALHKIPTSSKQTNKGNVQKHRNIKNVGLWFKRFISSADRRNTMHIFCHDSLQYITDDLNTNSH